MMNTGSFGWGTNKSGTELEQYSRRIKTVFDFHLASYVPFLLPFSLFPFYFCFHFVFLLFHTTMDCWECKKWARFFDHPEEFTSFQQIMHILSVYIPGTSGNSQWHFLLHSHKALPRIRNAFLLYKNKTSDKLLGKNNVKLQTKWHVTFLCLTRAAFFLPHQGWYSFKIKCHSRGLENFKLG